MVVIRFKAHKMTITASDKIYTDNSNVNQSSLIEIYRNKKQNKPLPNDITICEGITCDITPNVDTKDGGLCLAGIELNSN